MKTFLDSGVLLTAWRGSASPEADAARAIMADEGRRFVSAENVRLELIPKPAFEKRTTEVEFYNEHFNAAVAIAPFSAELGQEAFTLAKRYGLAAGDALNLAAAIHLGAGEFITSESPGKPMFRVAGLRILSLRQLTSAT